MNSLRLCLLLCVVGSSLNCVQGGWFSNLAVFGSGECPVVSTPKDFDINKYLGQWYEYERFPNWFEVGVKCGFAKYGKNDDGSISVENGGERDAWLRRRGRVPVSITGRATVPDSSQPAQLRVSFNPFDNGQGEANYFLAATDYTSYAVIFQCSRPAILFGNNLQFAWILTRGQGVAPGNIAALKAQLTEAGIDVAKFQLVEQQDCQLSSSVEA